MYLEKHSDLLHSPEWSTLIVLDSCRFDFFGRALEDTDLKGELRAVDSEARETRVWYKRHWSDYYPSITLISSQPVPWATDLKKKPKRNFFKAYNVDKNLVEMESKKDLWQEPQALFEAFDNIEIETQKVMLHAVPPHQPFKTKAGRRFLRKLSVPKNEAPEPNISKWARKNSWRKIETLYLEEIKYVLKPIESNISELNSPIVITSDHGELIGERGRYGHPRDENHPLQTIVPWFEVSSDDA